MSLGERIKQIRKEKSLTQQTLGERIGVKQNTIALIESGKRNTSDQLLLSICREFNVNEIWLRTGEGEMFRKQSREDELVAYMDSLLQSKPDDIRRRFAVAVSHLSTQQLEILESIALQLAEDLHAPEPQDKSDAPQSQLTELASTTAAEPDDEEDEFDPDLEAEVAEFRRQRRLERSIEMSRVSRYGNAG